MKLAVILLAACGGRSVGSPPPAKLAPPTKLDPCEMLRAALTIKSESFQRFYSGASCGSSTDARRPVAAVIDGVEVTQCQLDRFRIYHEGDSVQGAVLLLAFGREGDHWIFNGSYFAPPSEPDPETGGFEDTTYYCHVVGGYLAQRNGRWHAWQGPFPWKNPENARD